MTQRLLEIKPDGTEVWFEHDSIEKKNRIHYKNPDVEPVLEYCKALRLAAEYSKKGIKKSWWHYVFVPDWLLLKFRFEYGIDPWDKNNKKRCFEIINRDFPYLKLTEGFHVPKS
jgi:hypothetical protein